MQSDVALTFPCRFPIKVMGENTPDFENDIVMIANRHIPDLGEGAVRSTPSRTAKYLSVTIVFEAKSREQLDCLYRDMNAHPNVQMVL
ncbi:MAG TPA: DUF493 domain-containing protein [Mariprofundaceae bacterium]|nr:DUF493 domain-containing protein [Mariprofundaceae bacterium]